MKSSQMTDNWQSQPATAEKALETLQTALDVSMHVAGGSDQSLTAVG